MLRRMVVDWKVYAALRALRKRHIPVRGPIMTRKKKQIYLVGRCILTEPEIIALLQDRTLEHENGPRLLLEFKRLHGCKESGGSANEQC